MTVIVYVHGLWLTGIESVLLRRRLGRALNAQTLCFSYPSVRAGVTDNAVALGSFLGTLRVETLHIVAHSMGGPVVLRFFDLMARAADATTPPAPGVAALPRSLPPGRVVFTGSPVRGSRSAGRLVRLPGGRALLGRTGCEVLLSPRFERWEGGRDLGLIAGDWGVGLGRLLGPFDAPNDGTVYVSETRLPGATQHLTLPVSHSSMVVSDLVAGQIAAFLREGCFADSRAG